MIAARDWKSASDLSSRLREIHINDSDLVFSSRNFKYDKDNDILDQCINSNLFPEIDVCTCPICLEKLGILDEEGTSHWIEHLELEHRIKDTRIFNIYP
jgi:uncharacterized Zn-finger protein